MLFTFEQVYIWEMLAVKLLVSTCQSWTDQGHASTARLRDSDVWYAWAGVTVVLDVLTRFPAELALGKTWMAAGWVSRQTRNHSGCGPCASDAPGLGKSVVLQCLG